MVSLREGNPSQLLVYSMEVNIYIGFWTLKPKCTQYGLYGRATFKNARIRTGQGRGKPGSGDQGSGIFGAAPARCSDTCNSGRGFLERPANIYDQRGNYMASITMAMEPILLPSLLPINKYLSTSTPKL
jgi:hypothetical protein